MLSTPDDIGRQLRKFRDRRNLTQTDLAKLAGVPRENVCRYESGKLRPGLTTLQKLAKALDVSLDSLA